MALSKSVWKSPGRLLLALVGLYYLIDMIFDRFLSAPDRHDYRGYLPKGVDMEEVEITTEDGYILRLFILWDKSTLNPQLPPVYLQHGYGSSGVSWLLHEDFSGAYVLCELGHKVYILNGRGNPLSLKHQRVHHQSYEFWDFSFEDMGYDTVATVEYMAKKHPGQKLVYIGHSQGAVQIVTALADPRFKERIEKHLLKAYALTPVICTARTTSPLMRFSTDLLGGKGFEIMEFARNKLGYYHFGKLRLPENLMEDIREVILNKLCGIHHNVCFWAFWASDSSNEHNSMHMFGIWNRYHPTSVPIKGASHFSQIARDSKKKNCLVRRFDYGREENLLRYGKEDPPVYDFSTIKIPLMTIFGTEDKYYSVEDIQDYIDHFSSLPHHTHKTYPGLGHMSFTFGHDTVEFFKFLHKDILETAHHHTQPKN